MTRMLGRYKWLLLVAAMMVALLLAACGDDDDNGVDPKQPDKPDVARFASVLEQLQRLVNDRVLLAQLPDALRIELTATCGRLSRPDRGERHVFKKERRRQRRETRRDHDRPLPGLGRRLRREIGLGELEFEAQRRGG